MTRESQHDFDQFESLAQCPLCTHDSFEPVWQRDRRGIPLTFVQCARCRLVMQNPRMTQEALQRYFSSDYFIHDSKTDDGNLDELLGYYDYSAWESSYRRSSRYRLGHIMKFTTPPADLLEIGSATGFFLEQARDLGFAAQGLDVSSKFAAVARTKGFQIDEGFIETHPLRARAYDVICSFGAVTCWYDPVAGLKNVHQSLKPGGHFVFNHMDRDNFWYRIQGGRNWDYQHPCLFLWSQDTMRACLEKAGFEIVLSCKEAQSVSMARLTEYLRLPALRRLVYALRINELSFSVRVPFTRFVVCRPIPA